MIYLLKHILSYFFISIIATTVFIIYLKSTTYSGGEVGMAPLVIMLNSLITLGISITLILILKIFKIEISILKSGAIFTFIYMTVLLFYFKSNPFEINHYLGDLVFWSYLSGIFAFFIFNLSLLVRKNFT